MKYGEKKCISGYRLTFHRPPVCLPTEKMPISTCLLTYQPPPVCLYMNLWADSQTPSARGGALRSGSMAPERILRRCHSSISLNPSAVWTVRTYFFQSPSCVAKGLLHRGHSGMEHASFHFWMLRDTCVHKAVYSTPHSLCLKWL